ncbi:hypothetical protein EDB87DRAFT_1686770 [Lactarius vividus]|nr:hypothetical protein EDB87DRAFT_1686770 [Lactarius vividus]
MSFTKAIFAASLVAVAIAAPVAQPPIEGHKPSPEDLRYILNIIVIVFAQIGIKLPA